MLFDNTFVIHFDRNIGLVEVPFCVYKRARTHG